MARGTDELAIVLDRVASILAEKGRSFAAAIPTVDNALWITADSEAALLSLVADFASEPQWLFLSDSTVFSAEDLEVANESADPDDAFAASAVRAARAHVGHVGALYIHLLNRSTLSQVVLNLTADWYAALDLHQPNDEDEQESALFGSRSMISAREPLDPAELKRLARQVAEDKVFQDSPQPMQQQVAAAILGDRIDRYDVSAVTTEASRIWIYELKPAQNAELKPRAVALLKQGMKRSLIAAELNIPERRLKEIV
ncbi:MAG: hypothetical protein KF689_11650 [Gemmatimonadaceae bacterium]|nr:hypothetical protein [Gemmatimonadaceae bacterium]